MAVKRIAALVLALALFFSCASAAQAGNTRETKGYIALTFDDGPSGEITQQLLDGLAQRNVHATFFLCGYRIAQYPELAQRMAEDGHELGLHSDRHDYMQHMTKQEALEDLAQSTGIPCVSIRGDRRDGKAVSPAGRALLCRSSGGVEGAGAVRHFLVRGPARLG